MALACVHQLDRVVVPLAVDGDRAAALEPDRDVLGRDLDRGVPELHAHDRLDGLQRDVEVLERLGLVGGAPDVGVGGVGLLLCCRGRAGRAPISHWLISVAAAELVHEVGVQPRLVDAQVGVGQQAVAVEPLDVVALERRAVAPDVDAVLVHGADQHGAGDRAAERRGVEVGAAAGADVEGAAGERGEPLLDQRVPAVDGAGDLGAVLQRRGRGRRRCRARRTGRGRRCRCTGSRPCRASRPRPRRCRAPPENAMPTRSPTGEGGQDLAHERAFSGLVAVRGARPGRGTGGRAASPPVGSRPMTRTVSSPAMVPRTSGISALSNARGEELGGAGRGAQHDQVGAGVGADQQLGAQAGQPLRGGGGLRRRRGRRSPPSAGYGVHERAGQPDADLDGVELDQVARQRRLGDLDALAASSSASSAWECTSWWVTRSMISWCRAFLVAGRSVASAHRRPLQQVGEDRLLRVAAVLGLVPDHALRPVDDVGVDLGAAVGRAGSA